MYAHPKTSPHLLSDNGTVVQLPSSILGLVGSSPTLGKLFFQVRYLFLKYLAISHTFAVRYDIFTFKYWLVMCKIT